MFMFAAVVYKRTLNKMKKARRVKDGILNHCYQRTVGGAILFYNYADYLVYFTSYCVLARKYDVVVLSLCQMPDHLHDSLLVREKKQLASFKRDQNSWFAKQQNEFLKIEGPLFWHPFGSAMKTDEKKIRTNLIYVGNNPVERHLADKAEECRWNYVAYADSDHPFSKKMVLRKCSSALKGAMKEVRAQHTMDLPLNYCMIYRLFKPLDMEETQQLIDFIIGIYNVIDYKLALEYFGGSYKQFLTALHSTTGSEHDIKEKKTGRSDLYYDQMTTLLLREYALGDIHEFVRMDKKQLFNFLRGKTAATEKQIKKYLRIRDWELFDTQ